MDSRPPCPSGSGASSPSASGSGGQAYLSIIPEPTRPAVGDALAFGILAAARAIAVAGRTVVAGNPRLRPEHIRAD